MECDKVPKSDSKISLNVGFIGAGNMAKAIGEGLIKKGVINPKQIFVSAPSEGSNLNHWKTLGANTSTNNSFVVSNCPIVILAVKPQYAADAISSTFDNYKNTRYTTLVSIMAGATISSIEKLISKTLGGRERGGGDCESGKINVVRAMPNTPLLTGCGCTVFSSRVNKTLPPDVVECFNQHKEVVNIIFSVVGFCKEINESLIDAVGALSGCGPAYGYQIIEALSDGAVKLGVPRDLSYKLAAQTMLGAASMVLQTGKHPAQLKDEVCSPGGCTIAGISAMERNGVRIGLIEAIEAAYKKTGELAKLNESPS